MYSTCGVGPNNATPQDHLCPHVCMHRWSSNKVYRTYSAGLILGRLALDAPTAGGGGREYAG